MEWIGFSIQFIQIVARSCILKLWLWLGFRSGFVVRVMVRI